MVKNGSDKEYFGANIHTDPGGWIFHDYTIGEYSRSFLQNAFSRLERYADHGDADESFLMFDGTVDPAHRGPDDPQGI